MPTGYTHPIIDGTTTTFKQFATDCMRAFGATIHMRDQPSDKKYEPRKLSNHYKVALAECREEMLRVASATNSELIDEAEQERKYNIDFAKEQLDKSIKNTEVLNRFLLEAITFKPPTPKHEAFKVFMIEQLEETIKHDCNIEYYTESLKKARDKRIELSDEIRIRKLITLSENHVLYEKRIKEEEENCEKANQWVIDLLDSIE